MPLSTDNRGQAALEKYLDHMSRSLIRLRREKKGHFLLLAFRESKVLGRVRDYSNTEHFRRRYRQWPSLGMVAFLMLSVALAIGFVFGKKRKALRATASFAAVAVLSYGAMLMVFSVASQRVVLAAGQEKYFLRTGLSPGVLGGVGRVSGRSRGGRRSAICGRTANEVRSDDDRPAARKWSADAESTGCGDCGRRRA